MPEPQAKSWPALVANCSYIHSPTPWFATRMLVAVKLGEEPEVQPRAAESHPQRKRRAPPRESLPVIVGGSVRPAGARFELFLYPVALRGLKRGPQTGRLLRMLNTPSAVLAVFVVVVAVNGFLYFGYYLPRMTTTPPPGRTERAPSSPTAAEQTQPTTTSVEETRAGTSLEVTTTSTITSTATATPSP